MDSDFFCWIPQSNSESIIRDYTKIYGYTNNFHMCIIRVFDIDNDFVNYFIVEKGCTDSTALFLLRFFYI